MGYAALRFAARTRAFVALEASPGISSKNKRRLALQAPNHVYRLNRMNLLDRIVIDPNIRFGKPTVRGTRLTVGDVLGYLAGGMTEAELLRDFSQLSPEAIRACLAYAAERERRSMIIPAA